MRFYELVLITGPDVADEEIGGLMEKIEKLLKKKRKKAEKGEILHRDDWGVRKLSYPIEKQSKGRYIVLAVKCLPDTLSELERNLKLMDEVLRFQSVKLEGEPRFEEPAVVKEEKTEEVAGEVPQETETAAPEETGETAGV